MCSKTPSLKLKQTKQMASLVCSSMGEPPVSSQEVNKELPYFKPSFLSSCVGLGGPHHYQLQNDVTVWFQILVVGGHVCACTHARAWMLETNHPGLPGTEKAPQGLGILALTLRKSPRWIGNNRFGVGMQFWGERYSELYNLFYLYRAQNVAIKTSVMTAGWWSGLHTIRHTSTEKCELMVTIFLLGFLAFFVLTAILCGQKHLNDVLSKLGLGGIQNVQQRPEQTPDSLTSVCLC